MNAYAGAEVKEQKKMDDNFGIDINKWSGATVIKFLKKKSCKYTIMSLFEEPLNTKDPDAIITSCFLGCCLDDEKILKVAYAFPPIGSGGNDVEIEVRGDYHEILLKQLCGIFGSFKLETGDDGAKYCSWETHGKKFSFSLISLGEESLYYLGPKHSLENNVYYLLLRGQPVNRGPAH